MLVAQLSHIALLDICKNKQAIINAYPVDGIITVQCHGSEGAAAASNNT